MPIGKPRWDENSKNSTILEWRYIDYEHMSVIRSFMAVKVVTRRGICYIMEIQRRPNKNDPTAYVALSGLALIVHSQKDLSDWLNYFATHAPLKTGVMATIASEYDDLVKFKDFRHRRMGEVGGLQYTLLLAMSNIGIVDKPIATIIEERYQEMR